MDATSQPQNAGKARRKRTTAVGHILAHVVPVPTGDAALLVQLSASWSALCPVLSAHSYPTELKAGTLRVAAASDSVKHEISYLTPQIISGAGALLGYPAVRKVVAHTVGFKRGQKLRPQALSKDAVAKVAEQCKSVTDEGLRDVLARFGARLNQTANSKKSL